MNRFLHTLYPLAFAAGLAGIAGAALAASRHHPVALAMSLLIAAFFVLGALELRAFRRASRELGAALDASPADNWLAGVPAALRAAVQQRLEGLRVTLPGLALAPALAGLLVLLGMLGTFIGLVITLGGTAQAVSATADLAALRLALGAPVQGLGLAFSASVAGVTASAMLGLMVALARRERAAVAAQLDAALLGPLRALTAAHRRALEQQAAETEAAEAAQRQQRELVAQLQQFAQQMADQLAAQNARFHGETHTAYTALAASVDATLRTALTDSARLAGAAIQPAAEAAMAGIAREAAALHERVGTQVTGQFDTLRQHFEAGARQIAERGQAAADAQAQALARQRDAAQQAAEQLAERFTSQAQSLVATMADAQTRQQTTQAEQDAQRRAEAHAELATLSREREAARQHLADSAARTQQAADQLAERFAVQTQALLATLADAQAHQQAAQAEVDKQRRSDARAELDLLAREREAAQQLLATGGERVQQTLAELGERFAAQTQALVGALGDAHGRLQSAQAAGDAERLAAWRQELQAAGATQLAQQQQLADGLLSHTRDLVAQGQAQAQTTLSEAGALLKAAGEAPRAAVEVVAALREQLAQSQAQDRAALAERAELMQTVATLLAALQQAAGEQRAAIDVLVASASSQVHALVGSSATQLESLGERFAAQADATGQTLAEAATTLAASAAEMGSLGEGFGAAVEQFQGANAQLVQHLAALEERLAGAMTRSDEQLGYYVAQAREVIDLCLGSQKQVLDALQATTHG